MMSTRHGSRDSSTLHSARGRGGMVRFGAAVVSGVTTRVPVSSRAGLMDDLMPEGMIHIKVTDLIFGRVRLITGAIWCVPSPSMVRVSGGVALVQLQFQIRNKFIRCCFGEMDFVGQQETIIERPILKMESRVVVDVIHLQVTTKYLHWGHRCVRRSRGISVGDTHWRRSLTKQWS